MAKAPFDPYTRDLFENLLPIEAALEEEIVITQPLAKELTADFAPDPSGQISKNSFAKGNLQIEDFGEKIGGARKDAWQNYAKDLGSVSDEALASLPLSKVWPTPNYGAMLEEGVDAYSVALIRAIRESIPAKPKRSYRLNTWVGTSSSLKTLCVDLAGGKENIEKVRSIVNSGSIFKKIASKAALYESLGHQYSLANIELNLHSYSLYKGVEYRPPKLLWVLEERASKTSWPKELLSADTHAQLMDSITSQYETLFSKEDQELAKKGKPPQFIIFSQNKEYFVGKKIGKNYAKLAGPYLNAIEAREYRSNNLAALEDRLELYKTIPAIRRAMNEDRIGRNYRQNEDISPQEFSQAFGFKGVEFGNWVEQGRRQADLNNAFDALMDLSNVLDLPPKALSLNGELSLAFGARGAGGVDAAAAHYEPSFVAINLTKTSGAGSLAHEWWHALDHYFSRANARPLEFATQTIGGQFAARSLSSTLIRPEMVNGFKEVMSAIGRSGLPTRSAMLDTTRSKEYWSTPIEMSARAFEAYVIDSLEKSSFSNDYLANITSDQSWSAAILTGSNLTTENSYPYPLKAELPAISTAFDQFFESIETLEVDQRVKVFCTRKEEGLERAKPLGNAVGPSGGLIAGGELTAPRAGLIFGPTVAREIVRFAMEDQVATLNKNMLHQAPFTLETNVRSLFPSVTEADSLKIQGATLGDRIYLFADAMTSELDIQRTIFHELLHYGLRRYLSEDEFITQMHSLYDRDREIQKRANKWINDSAEGSECLKQSGRSYAIARGVDEALANLAEHKSAWVLHLRNEEPSQWQVLSRNLLDWSANLAQRLGLSKIASYLRGRTQSESANFIDEIFHKIEIDAQPSPDPFQDRRPALRTQATASISPSIIPNKDLAMTRIADHNKPPYVDVIPFFLELPQFRTGEGPLWDPAVTPPELIEAAQARFGSVREFVVPQKNGGPYDGECFQIDANFLAQEIGPREVTVHRLAHMETRSAAVAYQLPIGLDSVYLSIDYHGSRAQVYPYDPQKTQFIEVCKTVEKTMHARQISTRDQARFKSMWRVSCEDVMRARMGWQRARDVVGPRYKTPGILDPVYQNLYGPYAVPSPNRPNTPASDPKPLGAPVNLQTTYFPRAGKPISVPTQFLEPKAPSLVELYRESNKVGMQVDAPVSQETPSQATPNVPRRSR